MFSLKKLFGKDDMFFDLLEAGAEEAKASVDFFGRYLQTIAVGRQRRPTTTSLSRPGARKSGSAI